MPGNGERPVLPLGSQQPQVEAATAMERDKPVCQGLQRKPQTGGPTPPGEQKIFLEEPATGLAASILLWCSLRGKEC